MKKSVLGIFLSLFFASAAFAQVQNPGVKQTGSVTANNCVAWSGPQTIKDAGAACFTAVTPVDCSQLPAFIGDVTKPSGSCALTIPSDTITTAMLQNLAVTTGKIALANVTYDRIQNVSASRLLGNPTGAGASVSEISLGSTLAFSGSALQTVAHTGDATSAANSFAMTLATVNSNVGTFGDATHCATFTVNGKGLITAASQTTCAFPVTSVFTRTGAIVAQTDDYIFEQVSKGTTAGGNAAAGYVGEFITSNVASPGVSVTSGVGTNITSIVLTPGDWDVTGFCNDAPGAGTNKTIFACATALSSGATSPFLTIIRATFATGGNTAFNAPNQRYNVTVNTTVFLNTNVIFSGGTENVFGYISARRAR